MDDQRFCGWCGVALDPQEPIVVVEGDKARITSASEEPPRPAGDYFHSVCHAMVWPERHRLLLG